jgi:hypothetical protein
VGADSVEVLDGALVVAAHARLVAKASESLVLDHYLEVLRLKPGALPVATALARATASGAFGVEHERFTSRLHACASGVVVGGSHSDR